MRNELGLSVTAAALRAKMLHQGQQREAQLAAERLLPKLTFTEQVYTKLDVGAGTPINTPMRIWRAGNNVKNLAKSWNLYVGGKENGDGKGDIATLLFPHNWTLHETVSKGHWELRDPKQGRRAVLNNVPEDPTWPYNVTPVCRYELSLQTTPATDPDGAVLLADGMYLRDNRKNLLVRLDAFHPESSQDLKQAKIDDITKRTLQVFPDMNHPLAYWDAQD